MAPTRSKSWLRFASLLSFSLVLPIALTGCGIGPLASSSSEGSYVLTGRVHGGQQPVIGSVIQLYTAGTAGNGSVARAMISATIKTDGNGFFGITGDYTCINSTDQVYITATGGNPGAGTNNPSLVMMAALGNCGNLNSSTYISMNEVTTVAAAWALAPFMTSYTNVGSSSTNSLGLQNAFLNAQLLANSATGMAATLPSNLSIETNKLYALADAISTCINSSGGSACGPLFAAATPPAGSSATIIPPTDTLGAALDIVKFPGNNPSGVYNLLSPTPPFPTGYTQAPNDWTISLTVTGGGLNSPTSLAIDTLGNVWVAGYYGLLSVFNAQGTPLSSTGFGSGILGESYGIAVDTSGNVWVSNQELPSHSPGHGSIVKFLGASSGSMGTPVFNPANNNYWFYDSSMSFPTALAPDSNGDIMVANFADSTGSVYSSSGVLLGPGFGAGNSAFPVAIIADGAHGMWLANQGDTTVTHLDLNGNVLAHPSCCSGANGIAIDNLGNAWVANYYGGNVSEISPTGTSATLVDGGQDGGLANGYPAGLAVDAAQNVWVALYRGTGFAEVVGPSGYQAPGTALSPANGYGLDANLLLPYMLTPDTSGDIWVSNYGKSNIVMFFGLAAPTATPIVAAPTAP